MFDKLSPIRYKAKVFESDLSMRLINDGPIV